MIFLGLFIIELVILFFLSKSLIKSLATLCYRLTGSQNATINILAILFFPGTVIHELAHLLVAGVMFVPLGELEIMPKVHPDGSVQLGSVQIGHTDPFRRMVIGVAPVLVGVGLILGILYMFKDVLVELSPVWLVVVAIYIVFEIANTMFSSKKDMEGAIAFAITIVLVLAIVYGVLLLLQINPWPFILGLVQKLDLTGVNSFFKTSDIYLAVPLGIDLVIVFFASLFKKI